MAENAPQSRSEEEGEKSSQRPRDRQRVLFRKGQFLKFKKPFLRRESHSSRDEVYDLKDYEDRLKGKDSWIPDRDCRRNREKRTGFPLGRDRKGLGGGQREIRRTTAYLNFCDLFPNLSLER